MPELAIEAENVAKLYQVKGGDTGLRDLSLAVPPGRVLALLGPNGAGKTTAVRGLSTLLRFDRGRARVAGHDVRADAARVRERIGLVGQFAAVDDQLTAQQNLVLFGRLRGLDRRAAATRATALVERFGLVEAQHRTANGFSGGMRRRLDLAASLIVRPHVLFVDEPTTGLDPAARRDVWHSLRELVRDGTTVLLTTQYLEEADALADQIVVLDRGEVIARGSADELKAMVGPPLVQVRFDSDADTRAALPVLRRIDPWTETDEAGTAATLRARRGDVLVQTVQALASAQVTPAEVTLRKPSLDDVFLTLTSDTPAPSEETV